MTRRRFLRGGIGALVVLFLALAAAFPTDARYWMVVGVVIWWGTPYFGATSLAAMMVRYAVFFAAIVIGLPFAVSSPDHIAFWALLGSLAFILAPLLGAMAWFYGDIRRLLRERAKASDSNRSR